MKRAGSLVEKITFLASERQRLMDLMFEKGLRGEVFAEVKHLTGQILAEATECFDYAARDLAESFIPLTEEDRVYFPFYASQLETNKHWQLLQTINPDLFAFLSDLAEKSKRKEQIPDTLFNYNDPARIRGLVNAKKHDDIIGIETGGTEIYADLGGLRGMFTISTPVEVQRDSSAVSTIGKSYFIQETNERVDMICLTAEKSTSLLIGEIYKEAFGIDIFSGGSCK